LVEYGVSEKFLKEPGSRLKKINLLQLSLFLPVCSWVMLDGCWDAVRSLVCPPKTPGSQVLSRLRARNQFGWGPFGSTRSIVAAAVPNTPAAVPNTPAAVTVTAQGIYAKIAWLPPSNNGLSISMYLIQIKQFGGSHATSVYRNGGNPTIIA
jgi:hypothetical protein